MTKNEQKYLKTLLGKKGRRLNGQFLAEGVRLLEESLKHGNHPIRIFYAESLLNERSELLVKSFSSKKVPIQAVKARELNSIADTNSSQGIIGLFDIDRTGLKEINRGIRGAKRRFLLLDNISDPGNAGSLIRSAAAFNFDAVLFMPDAVEAYNPKVVRATAGTIFFIPLVEVTIDDIEYLKFEEKFKLIGTSLRGQPLNKFGNDISASKKIILAVGSEAEGLTPEVSPYADYMIRLEHNLKVESLNAAVAGSILMKELDDLYK